MGRIHNNHLAVHQIGYFINCVFQVLEINDLVLELLFRKGKPYFVELELLERLIDGIDFFVDVEVLGVEGNGLVHNFDVNVNDLFDFEQNFVKHRVIKVVMMRVLADLLENLENVVDIFFEVNCVILLLKFNYKETLELINLHRVLPLLLDHCREVKQRSVELLKKRKQRIALLQDKLPVQNSDELLVGIEILVDFLLTLALSELEHLILVRLLFFLHGDHPLVIEVLFELPGGLS